MTASTTWLLVGASALVTAAIKAAGPVTLGGRDLPDWLSGVIRLLAPALLAALVCANALAEGGRLAVGADTVGVGAAGIVSWRGGSVVTGVATAAAVTALLRALG